MGYDYQAKEKDPEDSLMRFLSGKVWFGGPNRLEEGSTVTVLTRVSHVISTIL